MASGGRPSRAWGRQAALVAMCVGLVVLVVGMFLPWLQSGRVERSSFAAGAAVRTLLALPGSVDTGLRLWPALVAVAAVAVALVALGLPQWAAPVAALAALVAGAVSITVLTRPSHGVVRLSHTGPAVTLLGCGLTLAAVAAYFLLRDRSGRRKQ